MLVRADGHGVLGFIVVLLEAERALETDGLFEDIIGRLVHTEGVSN